VTAVDLVRHRQRLSHAPRFGCVRVQVDARGWGPWQPQEFAEVCLSPFEIVTLLLRCDTAAS
jgi:hypothetical protein